MSDEDLQRFPTEHFWIKTFEVDDQTINLARWRYDGDYESGQLIDLISTKKAVVSEEAVDQKYREIFFRKYDLETLLFSLLDDDQALQEIRDFRSKLLTKKQKEIDMYRTSDYYIYETVEDQKNRENQTFK
jgi:hypothetical protein